MLAAYLIAHQHQHPGDYKSHDLLRAMKPCATFGLMFSRARIKFIEFLPPLHKDFVFRYPEKMTDIRPPDLDEACRVIKEILKDIHLVFKMKGFDISQAVEAL